jgi:sigma-E factor negative regulatory protein RseC
LNTKGVVIKTLNNIAIVKVPRVSACGGSCASCGGCGSNFITTEAENSIGATVGQMVILVSKTSQILLLTLITYFLPLIILLLLGIIFKTLNYISAISTILAFTLYFLLVKQVNLRIKKPRIGQIL